MTSRILKQAPEPIKRIEITGYYLEVDGIRIAGGYQSNDHHAKASAEFLCLVHGLSGYYNRDNRFIETRHFQWAKYYPAHWHETGEVIKKMAINNQRI